MTSRGDLERETDFLSGGGELGSLCREKDWSDTPLGAPSVWPQSLRTAVSILLNSRYPMFVFWGPELVKIYNDGYRPITGAKHPWALGRPAPEVWPEIWDTIGPMVERVIDHGEATWSDDLILFMQRNGFPEEVYFTFSYSPIRDESGGVGGLFCACTETTDKVLSERRLRTLHDLAAAPFEARTVEEACRLSCQSLEANDADIPFSLLYLRDEESLRLVAASGVEVDAARVPADSPSPWPLESVTDSLQPQLVSTLSPCFDDVPPGPWPEPPSTAMVLPLTDRGHGSAGAIVIGLGSRRALDDKYRDFVSLVAGQISTSISNARASEDERRRAEALAELDRAKTAFFSNVSHEFRTPLTLMLGPLSDLLGRSEGFVSPQARELLVMVHRNGQRLLRLVNTLLDFSRLEAGRIEAIYEPVDLSETTAELASVFRAAVEKAGLELRVDCPPLPEAVLVDRDQWEKIVLNLVSNAFKYTFQGRIDVSLHAQDGQAILEVSDTGTGIPADELPKLFQRFHRVQGTQGRTQEGSGIGLALVHELVKLHAGTVSVQSTLGRGSTFRVEIPLGAAHVPQDRIGTTRTLSSTALGSSPYVEEAMRWLPDDGTPSALDSEGSGIFALPGSNDGRSRVLLADDNADMRSYVARLLSPFHDVTAVADGRAALVAAKQAPPDLVLTDVMTPNIDGLALTKALRNDPSTAAIPIFLLSARADEKARVEAFEAGASDYLLKPFSARELLARISGSLALARSRAETTAALRQSEERFRHLADNAPVMVWVTDAAGRCTFLSKSWYEFTGQSPETALGFGWLDAAHPDDRVEVEDCFKAANDRQAPIRLEYRLRYLDGTYRWAINAAAPRISDDGAYLGYIGSVIDITDRKRAEEALRDADRRKDEFLATLAHELRNPLAPIRSGLDLLRLELPLDIGKDGTFRTLDVMERQLRQLVRLVDDLLDVSRISRGKIELRKERIDLRRAIHSAVEATQTIVDAQKHELKVELPGEAIDVEGDLARLAQVFSNLLHNAATYTDPGGHIFVSLRRMDGAAVVEVRDDGIGLPADQASAAFELFAQLERPRANGKGGLGIGLSLVKRLVQMHGGEVTSSSAGRGRGTTFSVRIPLPARARREVTTAPPRRASTTASGASKILVVDDNEDAAASLAMLLEIVGQDVRTANGGAEAVEVAETFRPQLILMDLGMPSVDGYEACRRIRKRVWGEDVHIIALTGWGQDQLRHKTRDVGFDDHIVKPIDREKIDSVLRQVSVSAGLGPRALDR